MFLDRDTQTVSHPEVHEVFSQVRCSRTFLAHISKRSGLLHDQHLNHQWSWLHVDVHRCASGVVCDVC